MAVSSKTRWRTVYIERERGMERERQREKEREREERIRQLEK